MPGPLQSVERAAAALRLLARSSSDLGIVELAQSLGLPKSTAHGIVRTLEQVGFVEQDRASGRYRLGRGVRELETQRLDVHELRSVATNWADSLASRSGESVRVCAAVDGRVVVVHHVFRPDDSSQTLDVGSTRPAHACAMGKVLLAYGGLRRTEDDLEPLTWRTLVDAADLDRDLAQVRSRRWALDLEETAEGQAGLAAPVHWRGGLVVAAAGVQGRREVVCREDGTPHPALLSQVRDCAAAITRELVEA